MSVSTRYTERDSMIDQSCWYDTCAHVRKPHKYPISSIKWSLIPITSPLMDYDSSLSPCYCVIQTSSFSLLILLLYFVLHVSFSLWMLIIAATHTPLHLYQHQMKLLLHSHLIILCLLLLLLFFFWVPNEGCRVEYVYVDQKKSRACWENNRLIIIIHIFRIYRAGESIIILTLEAFHTRAKLLSGLLYLIRKQIFLHSSLPSSLFCYATTWKISMHICDRDIDPWTWTNQQTFFLFGQIFFFHLAAFWHQIERRWWWSGECEANSKKSQQEHIIPDKNWASNKRDWKWEKQTSQFRAFLPRLSVVVKFRFFSSSHSRYRIDWDQWFGIDCICCRCRRACRSHFYSTATWMECVWV